MMLNETAFSARRECLGQGAFGYVWRPNAIGEHVPEAAKRCARFLRKDLGLSHSAALECVAEACGFPNWHALNSAATRIAAEQWDSRETDYEQKDRAAQRHLDTFAGALPLLVQCDVDLAPDEKALRGLEAFAEALAAGSGLTPVRARDLLAHMHGADDWGALRARDPVGSARPLYAFDAKRGAFNWSSACQALVDKQDSCFQLDGDTVSTELRHLDEAACIAWIAKTCSERPDFLEGWLALGTALLDRGADNDAGRCFRDAIRQADALIGDYRGQIVWASLDNRFYHRLLYVFMEWSERRGYLKQAIRLARRQLRLNPNDNLGLRYHLPALLAADSQYAAAERALGKLRNESENPHLDLIRSFCRMVPAPTQAGVEAFLAALFRFPFLRNMLLWGEQPDYFGVDDGLSRGIVPACGQIHSQFAVLFRTHPLVEQAYFAVLTDPEVEEAEKALHSVYPKSLRNSATGRVIEADEMDHRLRQIHLWKTQLAGTAAELAARKSSDWLRRLTS